jgi:hypothetical protein
MRAFQTSLVVTFLLSLAPALAQAQKAEDILTRFRPSLKGVEYDAPSTKDEIEACKVERVTDAKGSVIGFAVRDGQGKLLRRFVDTNGATTQREGESKPVTHLDQWSYYRDGFEVYREIDSNEDGTLDEVRWLNSGGTRIAHVKGGKVLAWKRISAEEATRVLVQALVTGDAGLVETVMATAAELKALGGPAELVEQTTEAAKGRSAALKALQESLKGWDAQTTWSRFDGLMPHVIPADSASGLEHEVLLYENGVVFVNPPGKADPRGVSYLHVPEIVKVGETWKFVNLPRAVDPAEPVVADAEQGSLRSSIYGRSDAVAGNNEPNSTVPIETLKKLADHDAKMPGAQASTKELAQWHLDRIEILRKVIGEAKGDDERLGYYKQVIHDLAEAYKSGLYPQGAQVFERLIRQGGKIGSFAEYRKILAEFDLEADKPGANLLEAQETTLKKLEAFLEANPRADEIADVLFQIANVNDFNANEEQAKKYFARLASEFPNTDVGKKAQGAITRLGLDGKTLTLSGTSMTGKAASLADYRGKTVLVLFWMSIAEPDRREINDLLELYKRFSDKDFEILSVNLDPDRELLNDFLRDRSLPWTIIAETGSLDSNLANRFGIISTPTMFLVDGQGKVVSHRIRKVSEIEKYLEKPLASSAASLKFETNK